MRLKWGGSYVIMCSRSILLVTLLAIGVIQTCDGARRQAQRRKDTSSSADLYNPSPSAESLQALAQVMGAAGFEHYTEGRPLVKRLIPADSQPDLDVVEHQGMIGKAGQDFPAFPSIPNTGFNCKNVPTGYYADLETGCQVFHICDTSRKISFLCPNGTIFSQSHLICDWWFKVDCASAPALYESSAEYYSNEQKKTHKVTQVLTKNQDLQQIGLDGNNRKESRRTPINVPSTTERFRYRQRPQSENHKLQRETPLGTVTATSRNYQSYFPETNYNPTQRTQATTLEKRNNLAQLFTNSFSNARSTTPTYNEPTYRPTAAAGGYNGIKEMQVVAETASFANNNNRQYLQDYNSKNYRPYPVYTPNHTSKATRNKGNPTLTTLYDIGNQQSNQQTSYQATYETTTKRPTAVPYTTSHTTIIEKHEPYARPGVSLLKDFIEKEKNKTITTTEKVSEVTNRIDFTESVNLQNRDADAATAVFESATIIPQIPKSDNTLLTKTSPDRFDVYTTTNEATQITTESSYQERRERLMKKLNLDTFKSTVPTLESTVTERYYGDQPNRPGLVVPPSLTPKTLHTLAIYYATALDNLSTTAPPDEEIATTPYNENEGSEGLPPLFSHQTINKYSKLFGQGKDNAELLEEIKFDPNGTYNELSEDLMVQQSQNPLSTSPQIRELAQVFTHALSAYLQDPIQFRKALSDIRPTHPSFGDILTTTEESPNTEPTATINEDDEEILGFSDDNKVRPLLSALREVKALNTATDYPIISETTTTPKNVEIISTTYRTTTKNPFICCGRISASYTTASTPIVLSTTSASTTDNVAIDVNNLTNDIKETVTTTENSYIIPKYGGFQNNTLDVSPYGNGLRTEDVKPLQEYVQVTNLPTAWGADITYSTPQPSTNQQLADFESKKIRTTTIIPTTTAVYFTETDNVELENEEELQRAHSQSFVAPQSNSLRQGKQFKLEEIKATVKKPSEELEAPSAPESITTTIQTTAQPTTTTKLEMLEALTTASSISSSIFTSPDSENTYQWHTAYDNWQSTAIDPITLNDRLNSDGPEPATFQLSSQTNAYLPNTAKPSSTEFTSATEESHTSTLHTELTTQSSRNEDRIARLIKDSPSTESIQDLTTIADTVVEKAKEIMGVMNATTTEKLINVMKNTKSKTVKRLILLLVQTCDDDHNTTAEASKKALLEALMAVSQKDMDELVKEETGIPATVPDSDNVRTDSQRKPDKVIETQEIVQKTSRRGKSLNLEASAVNSLSNPTTSESYRTELFTDASTTRRSKVLTNNRRGVKKFLVRTSPVEPISTILPTFDSPIAEARVATSESDLKTASDTRALELLRSLYTIAARWG